jgi:hypothetical protein
MNDESAGPTIPGTVDPRVRHRTRVAHRAGAALLLTALGGCTVHAGPSGVTTVVVDGRTETIEGPITCTAQPDGKLVILATDGRNAKVRVLMRRENQLVVEKVGIRVPGASGFTEDTGALWATKVDDAYTINGWMPPNAGEVTRHEFVVRTTCRTEVPLYRTPQPAGNGTP